MSLWPRRVCASGHPKYRLAAFADQFLHLVGGNAETIRSSMCDGSLITKGHFVKELGIELSTARRVVWLPRMTGDVVDPGVLPGIRVGRLRLLARGGMAWRMVVSRFRWIGGWSWPMTIAVAFIYTGCFASFISRHTSLPFWDGYVYVQKTWDLA